MSLPHDWLTFYSQIFTAKDLQFFEEWIQKPFRRSIRINAKRVDVQKFRQLSQKLDWSLDPIPWCDEGFWVGGKEVSSGLKVVGNDEKMEDQSENSDSEESFLKKFSGRHFWHLSGLFYMQEASSMIPPTLFDFSEKTSPLVLDMAAAPGSKTTQLAERLFSRGCLFANEPDLSRLKGMTTNLDRLGTDTILVSRKDGGFFGKHMPETFDAILLDAPCSGDGMGAKDMRSLLHWTPKKSLMMARLQKTLITSAFEALKVGGELVYSTCTFSPYENEGVVQHLFDTFPDMVEAVQHDLSTGGLTGIEGNVFDSRISKAAIRITPWTHESEGFFAIKLKKLKSTGVKPKINPHPKSSYHRVPFKKEQIIISYLKKHYGIIFELSRKATFIENGTTIWMIPQRILNEFSDFPLYWFGLKIGDLYEHELRISHSFALEYGLQATKNFADIDAKQLLEYYEGKDLPMSCDFHGVVILRHEGVVVGTAKQQETGLKNLFPRGILQRLLK